MTFTLPAWLTLAVTFIATAAPLVLPALPLPYQALASALIATLASIYHLYQPPPPSATKAK